MRRLPDRWDSETVPSFWDGFLGLLLVLSPARRSVVSMGCGEAKQGYDLTKSRANVSRSAKGGYLSVLYADRMGLVCRSSSRLQLYSSQMLVLVLDRFTTSSESVGINESQTVSIGNTQLFSRSNIP